MTAVTGPELARQWADFELIRLKLSKELAELQHEIDGNQRALEERSKALRATIGANIPQRLFDVGGGKIVMVSAARGVELVTLEKATMLTEKGSSGPSA